ncbi:MAG: hypothetical protein Unbinned3806contig1000_75 [Prokaryotic dsDNA virus sp.]|nr:MAG: hypothetical protein Unbinned3806contig1000_75 [Prokaryotic dsDNA virus sp.]|tara:strand:+ start:6147 stop:6689 length:543 start_codon:yes stop_codon:yes gene_type:complete
MNIFYLDQCPIASAHAHCDKHVPKMIVESFQMQVSSLIRHGVEPDLLPLTKSGHPARGGYHRHPCTIWAGNNKGNFNWLGVLAVELCYEFEERYGHQHFCAAGLDQMADMDHYITSEVYGPVVQAMPEEYKKDNPVDAYRAYYHSKEFAKWERGTPAPSWWNPLKQEGTITKDEPLKLTK